MEDQLSGIKKDPAKRRQEKIARYKQEKETKAKLEVVYTNQLINFTIFYSLNFLIFNLI